MTTLEQIAKLADGAATRARTGYDPEQRRVDDMSFQLGAASAYTDAQSIVQAELTRLHDLFAGGTLTADDFGLPAPADG